MNMSVADVNKPHPQLPFAYAHAQRILLQWENTECRVLRVVETTAAALL